MANFVTLADGSALDVARWPLPEGAQDGVLNRTQLAQAFSVSENTITKWMQLGMPVLSTGQNGVAYEFKLSHCWAWRQERDDTARAIRAKGDQLAAQAALAFRNVDEEEAAQEGHMTAKEVHEWAVAQYHRDRVAEMRGDLVRASRVLTLFEETLNAVRTAVYTLPDYAEREFGLTAKQVATLQGRCDQVLIEMRNAIEREALGSGTVVPLDRGTQQGELAI